MARQKCTFKMARQKCMLTFVHLNGKTKVNT